MKNAKGCDKDQDASILIAQLKQGRFEWIAYARLLRHDPLHETPIAT
jgi:hypothetical protein